MNLYRIMLDEKAPIPKDCIPELLASTVRKEKERKGIQTGKGKIPLSLLASDMILS